MNWLLLRNSLLVGGLSTVLAVGLGFCAALCLAGLSRRWRALLLGAAILALALPPFLVTNCWLQYLGHTGLWHSWLPLDVFTIGGAIWILTLLFWPLSTLVVWASWQRLEPEQLESDMLVTGWRLIRALLLPLASGALGLAATLTFVLTLNNFSVPALLQVKVFPAEMWIRFNTEFDTLGALRLAWPLLIGPVLLLVWFSRRELPWPHRQQPVSATLFRQQLGPRWFWASAIVAVLLCALSAGLPLFQILSVSRTWTELPGALAAGQDAVWNSLWYSAAAATGVVLLSLATAWASFGFRPSAFFRISDFGLRPFLAVAWLAFLLPGVLLGIGLIHAFNHDWSSWFYQSAGIVILAYVVRYFIIGWHSTAQSLRRVDPDLTDLALLEGAGRWQMLRHVQWPQIARPVLIIWYLVFLLCLWDVESMILVVPPGGETLALRIFNLLHYGHNSQVNALCFVLLAVALVPLVLAKLARSGWSAWFLFRGPPWNRTGPDDLDPGSTRSPIRSTLHAPRSTLHSAGTFLALAGFGLLLTSCTRGRNTLHSHIFKAVQIVGTRGVGVGQLNKPRSVAVDAQDNVYVVDMTGRVQKFSSNGVFVLSWQMPEIERGKPKGMGHDQEGNIFVVEPHYSRVNLFSPTGILLAQWGTHGTNAGQFSLPRGVAVDSHGEIFVSEYEENERVQEFVFGPNSDSGAKTGRRSRRSAPRWIATIGRPGTGPGEFNRAEGLCFDSQDRLYVADSCNHRIQVFSPEGRFLRAYGKPGKGLGELSYPYDICIDKEGRQYVCEFGNSRIQVFDAHDQPLEIIGGPGAEPGRFANPWALALDSAENLYVADSQNHRLQKLVRP